VATEVSAALATAARVALEVGGTLDSNREKISEIHGFVYQTVIGKAHASPPHYSLKMFPLARGLH
jgi:hypothetical protein